MSERPFAGRRSRELWKDRVTGHSIHLTNDGLIGIKFNGKTISKALCGWMALAEREIDELNAKEKEVLYDDDVVHFVWLRNQKGEVLPEKWYGDKRQNHSMKFKDSLVESGGNIVLFITLQGDERLLTLKQLEAKYPNPTAGQEQCASAQDIPSAPQSATSTKSSID